MATLTNQRELRRVFWETFPTLPRRKVTHYSGRGKMYVTDVRVTWGDWKDALSRDGVITQDLAQRATL